MQGGAATRLNLSHFYFSTCIIQGSFGTLDVCKQRTWAQREPHGMIGECSDRLQMFTAT